MRKGGLVTCETTPTLFEYEVGSTIKKGQVITFLSWTTTKEESRISKVPHQRLCHRHISSRQLPAWNPDFLTHRITRVLWITTVCETLLPRSSIDKRFSLDHPPQICLLSGRSLVLIQRKAPIQPSPPITSRFLHASAFPDIPANYPVSHLQRYRKPLTYSPAPPNLKNLCREISKNGAFIGWVTYAAKFWSINTDICSRYASRTGSSDIEKACFLRISEWMLEALISRWTVKVVENQMRPLMAEAQRLSVV